MAEELLSCAQQLCVLLLQGGKEKVTTEPQAALR